MNGFGRGDVRDRSYHRARLQARLAAFAAVLVALLAPVATAQGPREGKAILLVAGPDLRDPNFRQSVVLVSGHRGIAGPIGVIINRPATATLAQALPDIKTLEGLGDKVYFGGPVAPQALFFVFRAETPPDDAIEVAPGLYMDWDARRLKELLAREKPTEGLRVYAGHSAWAPGQLEAEVARGAWRAARPEERLIFSPKPETVWSELDRRAHATPTRFIPTRP